MDCTWIKKSPSLMKGVSVINQLEQSKFEQFLRRILIKSQEQDTEIFTIDERQKLLKIFKTDEESIFMAIKINIYLFKRMLKFIFMPNNLKNDLIAIGLSNEKAEVYAKVWSSETSATLEKLNQKVIGDSDTLNFSRKLHAELSSDLHKICKVPKTYISFATEKDEFELELSHQEIYNMFLQFEAVQNELDNLM